MFNSSRKSSESDSFPLESLMEIDLSDAQVAIINADAAEAAAAAAVGAGISLDEISVHDNGWNPLTREELNKLNDTTLNTAATAKLNLRPGAVLITSTSKGEIHSVVHRRANGSRHPWMLYRGQFAPTINFGQGFRGVSIHAK